MLTASNASPITNHKVPESYEAFVLCTIVLLLHSAGSVILCLLGAVLLGP